MEIYDFKGEDLKTVMSFEGWSIGLMRYSKRLSADNAVEMHKHNETDEAFILLEGSAVLYENDTPYELEQCKVYNIRKGTWHHIVLSEDTTVLIVENSNTSAENTERKPIEN